MKRKKSKKKSRQTAKVIPKPAGASKPAIEQKKPRGLVSIIIPTVKQTTMVEECVLAIKENTQHIQYEIIVVDDGSTKEVQDYLSALSKKLDFELILKPANEGFGKTCNLGLKKGGGEYFVLLNNDVIVKPGWLSSLVIVVEKDPQVGIVGARLLYPNGTVQHAGVFFNPQSGFDHLNRGKSKNNYEVLQQRSVVAVTFALALIKREVIEAIGFFDENLFISLEDVDYCLRAKDARFTIIYCPKCEATHFEGATRGNSLFNKDPYWLKKEIDAFDYFYRKWVDAGINNRIDELKDLTKFYKMHIDSRRQFLEEAIGLNKDDPLFLEMCGPDASQG
jgi:GT2 family glycosyltransferase